MKKWNSSFLPSKHTLACKLLWLIPLPFQPPGPMSWSLFDFSQIVTRGPQLALGFLLSSCAWFLLLYKLLSWVYRGFNNAHLLSPRSMRGQGCSAEFSDQGLTVKLLASLVFSFEGSRKKIPFQAHPFSAISASCEIEVSSSCSPRLVSAPGKPWTFLLCAPLYVYLAMKNFFHVYWNTSTLFL